MLPPFKAILLPRSLCEEQKIRASQVRLFLGIAAALRLGNASPQALLLVAAEAARNLCFATLLPGLGLGEEVAAEVVGEAQDARADGSAVAPVLALATAARNLLGEVPEPSLGQEGAGRGIARGAPAWVELHAGRYFGVL